MPLSADLTSVAAFQGYVQEFAPELIAKAFYSPRTVQMATTHEGVKGKKVLTLLDIAAELAVAWSSSFSAKSNAAIFTPRVIEVAANKIDLSFVPQDFESTYMGMFRKKGQNPGEDMPFAGMVLDKLLAAHAKSVDKALWAAVEAGSITPGTTPMSQTFDGILQIIKDLVTAGNATVATPGGAVTQTIIIDLIESMWDAMSEDYRDLPLGVFMSHANFMKYQRAYRDEHSHFVADKQSSRMTLDFGENVTLHAMPGLTGSDRIIMTPVENIHVAYDDFADDKTFEFEKNKRQIDFWLDFKIGVQIGLSDDDIIVVNDLE